MKIHRILLEFVAICCIIGMQEERFAFPGLHASPPHYPESG
jgi:hypothetical protein